MSRSLLLAFFLSTASFLFAAENPNVILILADDMGYGDVQALNPDSKIPTPHLDRLANEGMTFTDAHSPSSVCTPTRYATLTGRYCWRSRLKGGVLNGYGEPLINPDRPTISSFLQSNGYHTAVIGKWHLGLGFQKNDDGSWAWDRPLTSSPLNNGFDRSLVIPASLDFPPYVYVEGNQITGLPDREQEAISFPGYLRKGELGSDFSIVDCLDNLTEEAASHIGVSAGQEQPFFLYFPLTAPHKPVLPHPRYVGKSGLGPYGDFILQVDWTVGQILKAVDDAGITENTLILYTSDNGSFMYRLTDESEPDHLKDETVQAYFEGNHTANGPLRGTKADIWEAGHRVPFFARWPKVIEAGSKADAPICHTDIFATVADIIGRKIDKEKVTDPDLGKVAPDSFSLLPLMKGNAKQFKRAPVIHHSGGAMFAIRKGDWKLIFGNGSGGRQQPRGKKFGTPFQLYNLKEDIGETNDRYQSESEVAADLTADALRIMANGHSK